MEEIKVNRTIEEKIYLIRGQRVMSDRDLAVLYGVATKNLKQQVNRNLDRFPEDFMFRLSKQEFTNLRSQIATSSWGGTRYQPYAFTEHGIAMLSSVLRSERAIQININIMRTFILLKTMISRYQELRDKIDHLEQKYDDNFKVVFLALKQLMEPPLSTTRKIGF